MTSTDFHLRHLIQAASQERSHDILDAAFAIIEGNFDRFGSDFSPELLVLYAEAASDLRDREATVLRALDLYDRMRCEDDQFKVRALLIRCVYEARLGSQTHQLKGQHLLQQLQYALKFLMQALNIATSRGERYGFLVYNTSLVFWTVIRPMCRIGWQKHFVEDTQKILDALKAVGGGGGGKGGGKGGGGGGLMIPVAVDPTWIVDMTLNLAFGYEDAGRDPDAIKTAETAYATLDEMLKAQPERDTANPQLRMLVLNARAHFVRKTPAPQGAVRTEAEKYRGSPITGAAFFIRNGGIPKESAEDELVKVWSNVDTEHNIVEAREALNGKLQTDKKDKERGGGNSLKPQKLAELATALRAACAAECWPLARAMNARLDKFQVPAGRARIMVDLSKAELDVWVACNIKMEDPSTKMLLTTKQQNVREVEARCRAVRLCEQCIMAAKRVNDVDLVEDSAITMWNVAKELMCDEHRVKIHKCLQKCVDLLDEAQSMRLVQLRAQLHFEVACCEIAQDLLAKGRQELVKAQANDYTVPESDLQPEAVTHLAVNAEGIGEDPAPFIRRFDAAIGEQSHLLNWKLSLYDDPTDATDQVVLLLDQVRQQGAALQAGGGRSEAAKKLIDNLLTKSQNMLEAALQELIAETPDGGRQFESLSRTFSPPARVIGSESALQPLPCQAPATVKDVEMVADGKAGPQINDQRPKSEYEIAVARIKCIVMLMCKISREAYKVGQIEFAIQVADRAMGSIGGSIDFGPPPIEVEGALLLSEAAYTKALCLNKQLEELGVINGVNDEMEDEKPEGDEDKEEEIDDEEPELTPEEKATAVAKKREMIGALLFGMEKSHNFKQHWMVANGMAHWWNLHLELVELSFIQQQPQEQPQPDLLKKTLDEYRDGLAQIMKYLHGESAVPDVDFDQKLGANLALAHVNAQVAVGNLAALDVDQLLVLRRLAGNERKDLIARVTELCKKKEKPFRIEDLVKVKPDRLEGSAPAAAAPAAKKAPAPPKDAPPAEDADRSDLLGREVEVVSIVANIESAKDHDEAIKLIEQAVGVLNTWDPPQNNEHELTLWVELWTRIGRKCVGKPLNPIVGCKYALMCSIKGLGNVDAPIPPHASPERLRWRGACHSLCGQAFAKLVDPQRQEKESLLKLRQQSVEQYQRCCEYAKVTAHKELAIFGAQSLWNVAIDLLHSADTRQSLIDPLLMATRALAKVKYDEDPYFFVGLYASLFDCYSDSGQWGKINEMLSEAFPAVPAVCHRRLWSLRMLALSRQGKNVVVAMGMMKESQPKAQAQIWLVLARASSKRTDQLDAYMNAIKLLQDAQQADVVEVRLELADWLLRNGQHHGGARDQLAAAADMLLELEEDPDEEEEYFDEFGDGFGDDGGQSDRPSEVGDDNRSLRSFRSSRRAGSEVGSVSARRSRKSGRGRSLSSRGSQASSMDAKKRRASRASRASTSSARSGSSRSKTRKAEQDQSLQDQLYAHHYEALTRIYATSGRLATGADMHRSLLAASHFAVRFFAGTVEMANKAAQEISVLGPAAVKGELRSGSKRKSVSGEAVARRVSIHADPNEDAKEIIPPFAVPAGLAEWALEKQWPWRSMPVLKEVLNLAEKEGFIDGEACTYAGHADAFAKPTLTFHMLTCLENDLEEHGYHLWALPVLALHLQLSDAFTENAAVRGAMTSFVYMRLSRFSSECNLSEAAASALEKGNEALKEIPLTFQNFSEELEQIQSQRAGRGMADKLDSDWIEGAGGAKPVSAPWSCDELHAYEVWTELSNECLLHGDLFMACTLSDEAMKHAHMYGDRRTLRKLQIIKARLARDEGKYEEAVRTLKVVSAADVVQVVEIASILADAYRARRSPVLADEVLNGARRAIQESAKVASGAGFSSAGHVFAECEVRANQQFAEIVRLESATVSAEWLQGLDNAFSNFNEIREQLHQNSLYRRCIVIYLDFAEAATKLLHAKFVELNQNAALSTVNGGPLNCQILSNYAGLICDGLSGCRHSREALLKLAVPVEGLDKGSLSPPQVLTARIDVWEARAASTRRTFLTAAHEEKEKQQTAALSTSKARASVAALEALPGRPSRVIAFEEETHDEFIRRKVQQWNEETDVNIEADERKKNSARVPGDVERSIAIVSNAASLLQSSARLDSSPDAEDAGGEVPVTHPASQVEALVELGRLQLELAAEMSPKDAPSKWERPATEPNLFELQRMEVAEKYSNVLMSKDPTQIFKLPEGEEGAPGDAAAADGDGPKTSDDSSQKEIPYEEMGRAALCDALRIALTSRHFSSAQRALQMLAFEAYGVHCPEATFEFLAWLQSVDTILRAQYVMAELAPDDHPELVQLRLLRRLERQSVDPAGLRAYSATLKRLKAESPFFQRCMITDLPSISELLLSYIPPLTLVVTMQTRGDFVYVGATTSPPDGDHEGRLRQLKHFVTRVPVVEAEMHTYLSKLTELSQNIEKDLMTHPEIDGAYEDQFEWILHRIDTLIVEPLVEELAEVFWPHSTHIEHPANPQRVMLLPDSGLWGAPLECCASWAQLFGRNIRSAVSRDFSLHAAAWRVRHIVDPLEGEKKPVKGNIPAFRLDKTALLTDPYAEDTLRKEENPNSETMCMMHQRLVNAKVLGSATKCCEGQQFTSSPLDMKTMLIDSSGFFSLGFSRFYVTMPAHHFASQDLHRLGVLGIFNKCINGQSFRRQTKTDSMKSAKQMAVESSYATALIAAFRGVQSTVMVSAPVPTPLALRNFEAFVKSLQTGKNLAKALEEVTRQQIQDTSFRYMRALEGGELPPEARAPTIEPPEKGKGAGKGEPPPEARPDSPESHDHDLLPMHTQAAYTIIGPSWLIGEDAEGGGGGGGGKKK